MTTFFVTDRCLQAYLNVKTGLSDEEEDAIRTSNTQDGVGQHDSHYIAITMEVVPIHKLKSQRSRNISTQIKGGERRSVDR